jgi:hypothetical protein
LLMDSKERGYFILKNKSTGAMKEIPVALDFEYAETLLKKLERVNAHIAAETLPERIEYTDKMCGECAFQSICLPNRAAAELQFRDDAELEAMLDKYFKLKEAAKEYDDLDNELKTRLEEVHAVIGNYMITGKWIETKASIPAPRAASRYWKRKVEKIDKNK